MRTLGVSMQCVYSVLILISKQMVSGRNDTEEDNPYSLQG